MYGDSEQFILIYAQTPSSLCQTSLSKLHKCLQVSFNYDNYSSRLNTRESSKYRNVRIVCVYEATVCVQHSQPRGPGHITETMLRGLLIKWLGG